MRVRALLCACALIGCTRNTEDVIAIGEFGSFSGAEAAFGQATDRGVKLAIDQKNRAGGVRGLKIRLYTEDNQGKAEDTVSLVKKLIGQNKVLALLGEVASTRSLAAASIAQNLGVPMITPSSTNPAVTAGRDYIFGTCYIDPVQGPVLARFAAEDLRLKRVAILRDTKSDYSIGLTKYFVERFEALGGRVIATVDYGSADPEFKAQLTKIRPLNPDGLFIPGYYNDIGTIVRQARELGITSKLLGADGWGNPRMLELARGAAEGAYFTNFYSPDAPSEATQKFVADYLTRFGAASDPLAAAGYDATGILLAAIERATELTPKAIRDEIARTKNYDGATGRITMNADGNADKDVFITRVRGRGYAYVKTFRDVKAK